MDSSKLPNHDSSSDNRPRCNAFDEGGHFDRLCEIGEMMSDKLKEYGCADADKMMEEFFECWSHSKLTHRHIENKVLLAQSPPQVPAASFAQIVKKSQPNNNEHHPPGSYAIFVKAADQTECSAEQIINKIHQKVNPRTIGVKIKEIKKISSSTVVVKVSEKQQMLTLKSEFDKISELKAEPEKKLHPRIRIFDLHTHMDSIKKLNDQETNEDFLQRKNQKLVDEIICHNFTDCSEEDKKLIKIVTRPKPPTNTGFFDIILQLPPNLYKILRERSNNGQGRGSIQMDYSQHRWSISILTRRCSKCLHHSHSAKFCKSEVKCSKCGQGHPSKECPTYLDNNLNCYSCQISKKPFNHNFGSPQCPHHEFALDRAKAKIDFGY